MIRLLKKYYPFLVIVLVWVIFSAPALFQGKIPLAADITVGMYYPWLDAGKVPVKNAILTDTVSQFWIWRTWALDSLKQHHWAFWNPYILSGVAQSTWFHTILFQPTNLFYFLLPKFPSISAIILFQLLFSLITGYFFFKHLTSQPLIGLFGAITYSFSSYFIGWLTWGTVSWTLACLPFSLYSIDRIFQTNKSLKWLIFSFGIHLFAFLGGHPQTYFYYLIIVFSFALIRLHPLEKSNKIIHFLIVFILSVLCLSFITLPSLKIINDSIRSTDVFLSRNNYGFVPYNDIFISAITPSFFGNPATNNYWGGQPNYQEKLFWVGIVPLLLALIWIFNFFQSKKRSTFDFWLIGLFVAGIFLSTQYPFGFLIYLLKIPLISSAPAGRALILTDFSLIIMAVLALKDLATTRYRQQNKSVFLLAVIFILLFAYIAVSYLQHQPLFQLKIAFRNLSLSLAVFLASVFALRLAAKKHFHPAILLIIITFFDLFYFAKKYTPFNPPSYYFPQNQLLDSLQPSNSQEFYRVDRDKSELLPPNMWQEYKLASTEGYDPMASSNYLNYLISQKLISLPTRVVEWQVKDLPSMPPLGIKYFLTLKRDRDNQISPQGKISPLLDQKVWIPVKEVGSVAVLQNKYYQPPYFLTQPGDLKLLQKSDSSWLFESDSKVNNQLIILENNNSNWQATIDNQRLPVGWYQNSFKSLSLPAGRHQIHLYYQDYLFILGSIISAVSLAVFIAYLFILKLRYHFN